MPGANSERAQSQAVRSGPGQAQVTSPQDDPVIIDGGDRMCVQLLLEVRARIAQLPGGTVIHLIASDPAAPIDLPAWCHLTGHAYLGPVPGAPAPTYALRTVGAPSRTEPASPWLLAGDDSQMAG